MDIIIKQYDEVHVKLICNSGITRELYEHFSFYVPGYKFMPAYKIGMWDGKIRLINLKTNTIYKGLLKYIEEFAKTNNYSLEIQDKLNHTYDFSIFEAKQYIDSLYKEEKLNTKFTPRDYQLTALINSIRNKRSLILSPTGSGKSLIIYLLCKFYSMKKLIIVPTINLVLQLQSDFAEYSNKPIATLGITGTTDKNWKTNIEETIVVSTWQSLAKMPASFFDQFGVIIGDEAHLFKAKSLIGIMEKCKNIKYRFGFTGTLDDSVTHQLILEGVFGRVYSTISTKELMNRKELAELEIKILIMKYSEETRKLVSKITYDKEMDFIVSNHRRNTFIKNLALSLNGNTLLLFQYIAKHGEILYDLITKSVTSNRKVFFIFGGTKGEQRNSVRQIIEEEKDALIIASSGVFSTGINIKNIHNIIFTSPSKSKIKNLQSIGRGLRVSDTKQKCTLFDIGDDLQYKNKMNYTLKHMTERIKYYTKEQFQYKVYNISLED